MIRWFLRAVALGILHRLDTRSPSEEATVGQMTEWCEEARDIHKHFIEAKNQPPELGDDAWHERWVRRYNAIIAYLKWNESEDIL